jgi:hypothetical protein
MEMRLHGVITKEIAHDSGGLSLAGSVNAAIAAHVNEHGATVSRVSSEQRVAQRRSRRDRDDSRTRRKK